MYSPFIKCTTVVLDSDSVTALLTTKTSTLTICHTAVTVVIAIHCCNHAQASYYTPFCVRRLVRHGYVGNVVRRLSIDNRRHGQKTTTPIIPQGRSTVIRAWRPWRSCAVCDGGNGKYNSDSGLLSHNSEERIGFE